MLPRRLGARFALEALFLVLLAVGTGLAHLRPLYIVGVMAAAWILVALAELTAERIERSPLSYLLPQPRVEDEEEPERVFGPRPEERTIVAPLEPEGEKDEEPAAQPLVRESGQVEGVSGEPGGSPGLPAREEPEPEAEPEAEPEPEPEPASEEPEQPAVEAEPEPVEAAPDSELPKPRRRRSLLRRREPEAEAESVLAVPEPEAEPEPSKPRRRRSLLRRREPEPEPEPPSPPRHVKLLPRRTAPEPSRASQEVAELFGEREEAAEPEETGT